MLFYQCPYDNSYIARDVNSHNFKLKRDSRNSNRELLNVCSALDKLVKHIFNIWVFNLQWFYYSSSASDWKKSRTLSIRWQFPKSLKGYWNKNYIVNWPGFWIYRDSCFNVDGELMWAIFNSAHKSMMYMNVVVYNE